MKNSLSSSIHDIDLMLFSTDASPITELSYLREDTITFCQLDVSKVSFNFREAGTTSELTEIEVFQFTWSLEEVTSFSCNRIKSFTSIVQSLIEFFEYLTLLDLTKDSSGLSLPVRNIITSYWIRFI